MLLSLDFDQASSHNKRWLTKDETYATLTSLWDMNKPPVFNFGKNDIDSVIVIEKAIQRFIKHIEVSEVIGCLV